MVDTVTNLGSMGRIITQTRGQAFQTLGRAFGFFLRLQRFSRMFENKCSTESFVRRAH